MALNDHQDARERLLAVRQAIAGAAKLADRDPADITLIAVSKTHSAERIAPLLVAGQRIFGENRVNEAQEKWPALKDAYPDVALHLVGRLQSKKADEAVQLFDAIHSVDRISVIDALARAMEKHDRRPACFLQVNIGNEPQKGGCDIVDVPAMLKEMQRSGLPAAGLMCVPPVDTEAAPYFALLAKIARDNGVPGLSMGMSGDYETAIMLGATHVRIGTALFGERP